MLPRACPCELSNPPCLHSHLPQPPLRPRTWPVDETKLDTYTGSSETELLNKLKEHLPSGGPLQTSLSTGDGQTAGADPSAGGNGKSGQKEEEIREADSTALGAAEALIGAFDSNVDVARLLRDIRHHAAGSHRGSSSSSAPPPPPTVTAADTVGSGSSVTQLGGKSGAAMGGSAPTPIISPASKPAASSSRRRREEVEAEAAKQGASGG